MINEVHYDADDNAVPVEFIELYNGGESAVAGRMSNPETEAHSPAARCFHPSGAGENEDVLRLTDQVGEQVEAAVKDDPVFQEQIGLPLEAKMNLMATGAYTEKEGKPGGEGPPPPSLGVADMNGHLRGVRSREETPGLRTTRERRRRRPPARG